ncbi:MAG: TIGR00266 family protein, partial [Spirochaetia bacterium]
MEYLIENQPVFTTLTIKLLQGELVKAEAGSMVSMSSTVELDAKATNKGIFNSLKAAVGGESFFTSLFTAKDGPGEVILAPPTPGDIKKFPLTGSTIFAQSGAYLAGSADLELSTQGSFKSMIAGENLFLQKINGQGLVFLHAYGSVFEKYLDDDETYVIDTGHLVA